MTTLLQQSQPKILLPGEGESYKMLTHTFVRKITGDDTQGEYAMFEMIDYADTGAPLHSHPWEETFYILEGEIEMQMEGSKQVVSAGSVIHLPKDTVHAFKICSPVARALIIMSPALREEFFQDMSAANVSLPEDLVTFQEISAKHGLSIL